MQNVLRTHETHIYQRNIQIYAFIKKRRAVLSPSCTILFTLLFSISTLDVTSKQQTVSLPRADQYLCPSIISLSFTICIFIHRKLSCFLCRFFILFPCFYCLLLFIAVCSCLLNLFPCHPFLPY